MEEYYNFWHNKASHLDSQLLLDFDTFINIFAKEIEQQTSIVLTDQQRLWIKAYIDPENQNQVYKNGFLLFVKDYWSLPSWRTKFFNMKINVTQIKDRINGYPMVGWIKIKVSYPNQEENAKYKRINEEYLIQNDQIVVISSSNNQNKNKSQSLPIKGFISIGSSTDSQIQIPHHLINPNHFKIIYQTAPKNTFVFVRDISQSNRVRYLIDSQNKYVVLRSGMVFGGIGLIEGLFEIWIEHSPSAYEGELNSIENSMNLNRKSILIDQPDRPLKTISNFNLTPLTEAAITDLFDRNLFYPPKLLKPKASLQEPVAGLKIDIRNTRTLESEIHDSKSVTKLIIGRDPNQCNIVIDHISIRPIEIIFELINGLWFTCGNNINNSNVEINDRVRIPSLYLGKEKEKFRARTNVGTAYPEYYTIGGIVNIMIEVKGKEEEEEEDVY